MEPLTGPTGKVDAAGQPAKPWVSVIIPALNEEETIGDVVRAVLAEPVDEAIVVDNASRDETAARARSAGARVVAAPRRG